MRVYANVTDAAGGPMQRSNHASMRQHAPPRVWTLDTENKPATEYLPSSARASRGNLRGLMPYGVLVLLLEKK